MSTRLQDVLPESLRGLRSRPLFVMQLLVRRLHVIGGPAGAARRVGVVAGGSFAGDRLAGRVLEGGSDWQTLREDGSTRLDVRLVLKTRDGAMIGMSYQGVRHGPAAILARIEKGEAVDPQAYYFRINPVFETVAPKHAWLNNILAIGIGARSAEGPLYSVFEIL